MEHDKVNALVAAPPFLRHRSIAGELERRRLSVAFGAGPNQKGREVEKGCVSTVGSPGARRCGRHSEARRDGGGIGRGDRRPETRERA